MEVINLGKTPEKNCLCMYCESTYSVKINETITMLDGSKFWICPTCGWKNSWFTQKEKNKLEFYRYEQNIRDCLNDVSASWSIKSAQKHINRALINLDCLRELMKKINTEAKENG